MRISGLSYSAAAGPLRSKAEANINFELCFSSLGLAVVIHDSRLQANSLPKDM